MGQALTWLLLLHICLGSGWLESASMEGQGCLQGDPGFGTQSESCCGNSEISPWVGPVHLTFSLREGLAP